MSDVILLGSENHAFCVYLYFTNYMVFFSLTNMKNVLQFDFSISLEFEAHIMSFVRIKFTL